VAVVGGEQVDTARFGEADAAPKGIEMRPKFRVGVTIVFLLLCHCGCSSCGFLSSQDAKIESYLALPVPLDFASLKGMPSEKTRNLSIRKEKEHTQGFAGARTPLGLIFLPVIVLQYLTLEEWWQVRYTDPQGNKLSLRFEEGGKGSLIDGTVESPNGPRRHIAVLKLAELKRRVLLEVAQQSGDDSVVRSSVQKQTNLLAAYQAALRREGGEERRGRLIREMLLVLQSEGLPLLSELLANRESDASMAEGIDPLCRSGPGTRSDFQRDVLTSLARTTVGPLVAAKALRCFEWPKDSVEARPFTIPFVRSICAGSSAGLQSLEVLPRPDGAPEKAMVINESELTTFCPDSPGATLVRLYLRLPTTPSQISELGRSPIADRAAEFLDPTVRCQWDLLWLIADRNPALIFDMVPKLDIETFAPTGQQVDLFFSPLWHAETKKGLLSRDGYGVQAILLDILLRADPSVLRQAKRSRERIKTALKSAKGEARTTLELLSLLLHPEGSRRVEGSLLGTVSLECAQTRGKSNDPNRSLFAALRGLGGGLASQAVIKGIDVPVDSEETLVYFALRRFGCQPDALLEAVRKKSGLTCPRP
jgi:hypothetical protein